VNFPGISMSLNVDMDAPPTIVAPGLAVKSSADTAKKVWRERLDKMNDFDAWAGWVWRGFVVSLDVGADDDGDDAIPAANTGKVIR
jgi:hypothetical protein